MGKKGISAAQAEIISVTLFCLSNKNLQNYMCSDVNKLISATDYIILITAFTVIRM